MSKAKIEQRIDALENRTGGLMRVLMRCEEPDGTILYNQNCTAEDWAEAEKPENAERCHMVQICGKCSPLARPEILPDPLAYCAACDLNPTCKARLTGNPHVA